MNRSDVYRMALDAYGDPVEAEIAAAQYQLETGGQEPPGWNLFGIKGPGATLATTEIVDGQPVRTRASFREYPDPRASIVDRLAFLRSNPRYAKAGYFDARTPAEKAEALQRAGYATDPHYAAKLRSLMGEQMQRIPVSDFPQFDPARMAEGMQLVSGYPGMASTGAPTPAPAATPAEQSFLTQLTVDPIFNIGMSLLAAGTSGQDLGTALQAGMTGALRNQLLMDSIAERREEREYQRGIQSQEMMLAEQERAREAQQRQYQEDYLSTLSPTEVIMARVMGPSAYAQAQMKPQDMELKAVIGPDGTPRYVTEPEALGMEPYSKPMVQIGDRIGPPPAPGAQWLDAKTGKFMAPTGPGGEMEIDFVRGSKGWQDKQAALAAPRIFDRAAQELESAVNSYGAQKLPTEAQADLSTYYTYWLTALRNAEKLGAIDRADLELIEGMVTNPSTWSLRTKDAILQQIRTSRRLFNERAKIEGLALPEEPLPQTEQSGSLRRRVDKIADQEGLL